MAVPKKRLSLIFAFVFLLVLLAGYALVKPPMRPLLSSLFGKKPAGKIKLVYWGLFEPKEVMAPLINEYQKRHPEVEITYTPRSFASLSQYKELLLARLKQGKGPDIMRLHLTWVPQFAKDLAPLPSSVMTAKEFSATFYPVAKAGASVKGSIFALPLQYDGLALFLNDRLVAEATSSAKVGTWPEFRDLAAKLTKLGAGGEIARAGAAVGLASNVPHAADIYGLMLAQSDLSIPQDLDSAAAQDALSFYVNFYRGDKVWDGHFTDSIHAFAREEAAMIFAPSWRIFDIKNLNPSLRFSLAPVPQIPSLEGRLQTNVHWATFWVEAVSGRSKNVKTAWEFLKFLSSKESLKNLYTRVSQNRPFTPLYPRLDLAEDVSVDPLVSPVLSGAPTAKSFITTDMVGNDPYVDAIKTAIEAVAKGSPPAKALGTAKANIEKLLATSGQK